MRRGGGKLLSWVWQDDAPRLFSVSTPAHVTITHKTTLFNIIISSFSMPQDTEVNTKPFNSTVMFQYSLNKANY